MAFLQIKGYYGQSSYGRSPWGGIVPCPYTITIVSPASGAVGVRRRPTIVFNVFSLGISPILSELSVFIDDLLLVTGGVCAPGWSLSMTSLGEGLFQFILFPSDTSAQYLPASTELTLVVSYACSEAQQSFTTDSAFRVVKTEVLVDQQLRVYLSRPPLPTTAVWNKDNYGLRPLKGIGNTITSRSVEYTAGNDYLDVSLAATPGRGVLYDVVVLGLVDANGEEVGR